MTVEATPAGRSARPTAALGVKETEMVFNLIREMRDQGHTLVMISHNLNHVFDMCDRITVMKTGRNVGTRKIAETDKEEIVRLIMTGGFDPAELAAEGPSTPPGAMASA